MSKRKKLPNNFLNSKKKKKVTTHKFFKTAKRSIVLKKVANLSPKQISPLKSHSLCFFPSRLVFFCTITKKVTNWTSVCPPHISLFFSQLFFWQVKQEMSAWIVSVVVIASLCSSSVTPNCVRAEPETYDGTLCLSDIKLLCAFPDKVWVSDMQDLNLMLPVDGPSGELLHFATVFGLTFCYDHGNVFLPNTNREFF